jgi:hypothetical protein
LSPAWNKQIHSTVIAHLAAKHALLVLIAAIYMRHEESAFEGCIGILLAFLLMGFFSRTWTSTFQSGHSQYLFLANPRTIA